jgi:serine/threonine-protein kinase
MLTSVTAWVAGAAAAVAVSVLALVLMGSRISGPDAHPAAAGSPVPPLSPAASGAGDVVAPASTTTSPAPAASVVPSPTRAAPTRSRGAPTPSPSSRSTASGESSFSSAGGTVDASCSAAGAYLVSWSPAPGYQIADVVRGPAPRAWVTFDSGAQHVTVTITCSSGQPQATVRNGDD